MESSQLKAVRVLIFDLDGTLIDSERDLALAVNATRDRMGLGPLRPEMISSYVGQGAPILIRKALGPEFSEGGIQEGLEFFLTYYREHALDNTAPYVGVREGLEQLGEKEYKMAVLTNKPVRISQAILKGLGLAKYFEYVYGGNSFERKKPDRMGVDVLLRDFGAQAREAMMVGDTAVDVQTARNAGIWACGVTYGMGSGDLKEAPPDVLVDSLVELAAYLNSD